MKANTPKVTPITRDQMIKVVESRVASHAKFDDGGNSFAARGARTRRDAAQNLLRRLQNGATPSTQEVVGYFGKGARFAE